MLISDAEVNEVTHIVASQSSVFLSTDCCDECASVEAWRVYKDVSLIATVIYVRRDVPRTTGSTSKLLRSCFRSHSSKFIDELCPMSAQSNYPTKPLPTLLMPDRAVPKTLNRGCEVHIRTNRMVLTGQHYHQV